MPDQGLSSVISPSKPLLDTSKPIYVDAPCQSTKIIHTVAEPLVQPDTSHLPTYAILVHPAFPYLIHPFCLPFSPFGLFALQFTCRRTIWAILAHPRRIACPLLRTSITTLGLANLPNTRHLSPPTKKTPSPHRGRAISSLAVGW